ncbi:MAG: HD domain-containing protein [Myxococcota bacterium]
MPYFFSPAQRAELLKEPIKAKVKDKWNKYWDEKEQEKYLDSLIAKISSLFTYIWRSYSNEKEIFKPIEKALLYAIEAHADQKPRKTGEPYVSHPLDVAISCAEKGLDITGITASLLHDVIEDTTSTKADLRDEFNNDVAEIVDSLSKVKSKDKSKIEKDKIQTFFKILDSNHSDNLLRTILIKILDRLDNMKTVEVFREEKQRRYARETLYIYSSLASIMGMGFISRQLRERSIKPFFPKEFKKIQKKLSERQNIYLKENKKFQDLIKQLMANEIEVKFHRFYPTIADYLDPVSNSIKYWIPPLKLRIRVKAIPDMYTALGIIHSNNFNVQLPNNVNKEIPRLDVIYDSWNDYVVSPLANGYRAITTEVVYNGNTWLLEIVSQNIEGIIDRGILSNFKSKDLRDFYYTSVVAFINNIADIESMRYSELQALTSSAVADIQVRTDGRFIRLPINSTILDLAYTLDSDLGLYCEGGIVDGTFQEPLFRLQHGMDVKIQVQKEPLISNKLLDVMESRVAAENFKRTIRKYLLGQAYELGKEDYKRFIRDNQMDDIRLFNEHGELQIVSVDDVIDVGLGKTTPGEVLESAGIDLPTKGLFRRKVSWIPRIISEIDNVMYHYPDCCNVYPRVDDDVVMQYKTPDENYSNNLGLVEIHFSSCPNLDYNKPIIPVKWDIVFPEEMEISIMVEDSIGLAGKITGIVARNHLNIISLYTDSKFKNGLREVKLKIELRQGDNWKIDQKRFISCIKMLRKIKEIKTIN